jgi:hypothetical protein
MFIQYDIRSYSDPAIRNPVPVESQPDWDYPYVQIRKSELAGLLSERYVGSVHLTYLPTLSILPGRMDNAPLSGWKPRSWEEAVVSTAESLIQLALVKR